MSKYSDRLEISTTLHRTFVMWPADGSMPVSRFDSTGLDCLRKECEAGEILEDSRGPTAASAPHVEEKAGRARRCFLRLHSYCSYSTHRLLCCSGKSSHRRRVRI